MGKENKATGPPQPILIQGHSLIKPPESSVARSSMPVTATASPQYLSTVEEALAKVQYLEDTKPSTNVLLALGLLFFFAIPLLLFFGTDAYVLLVPQLLVMCCSSAIIGIVLMLLAETKHNAWKRSTRLAKAEALRLTNTPVEDDTKYRAIYAAGGFMLVVGLLLFPPMVLVGIVLMIPSGLASMNQNNKLNRSFERMQEGFKKP